MHRLRREDDCVTLGAVRGFVAIASAVLLAIGLAVAGLVLAWQPPTYSGVGVAFTAAFPGSVRAVTVTRGATRVAAWVARHGDERYAVVVESQAALHLAPLQRRQLLATVTRRIGGPLVSGWFAYAPLQRACGPPARRARLAGHLATASFVGPVQPLHGLPQPCLGTLVVQVGGAQLIASALGPRASVRLFVDSVALAPGSA